jgi:hypothetical protein
MFPVRYELNSYILFRRNSVFKVLKSQSRLNSDSVHCPEKIDESRHMTRMNKR